MIENSESKQHYLFAILLFIAGLLIILIFLTVRSQADDTNTSASVGNAAPSVGAVTIAEASAGAQANTINLSEGATKTLYCHAEFIDNNGCDEVDSGGNIKAVFYSDNTDANCDADDADCYIVEGEGNGCTVSACAGGTDTTATVECQTDVQYYADATDWTCQIQVNDASATSTASFATTTINACVGLAITGGPINFGTVALGATSNEQSITLNNTCNSIIDADASATDITCDVGFIEDALQRFSLSQGAAYNTMTAMSSSSQTVDLNIPVGLNENDIVYQMLQLPNSGVGGTCSGTQTWTAVANS